VPRIAPRRWTTIKKVLLRDGWRFGRQEGSQRSDVKPGLARPVAIPIYREAPVPSDSMLRFGPTNPVTTRLNHDKAALHVHRPVLGEEAVKFSMNRL